MLLIALTLVFVGITCMFFCLWKSQDTILKLLQEEHKTTRRYIERLNVRCATLSAQLDSLAPPPLDSPQKAVREKQLNLLEQVTDHTPQKRTKPLPEIKL